MEIFIEENAFKNAVCNTTNKGLNEANQHRIIISYTTYNQNV